MARDLQNDGYSGLLRKVAGVDLFAPEAHFHRPCYSKFYSKHQTWKGYHKSSNANENVDPEMLATRAIAYESVKSFTQKEIITNQNVTSLNVLRDHYIHQLEQENYPNPHFRSEKLIKKIEKDESISQLVSFSKVSWKGCISFWLVFSSEMSVSMAVAESYLAASEDKLKDVATFIREVVLKAFKSSKEMSWPPSIDDIEKMLTEKLPEELERFLNLIFGENEPNTEKCERIKRFVYSIRQVVCRAVSQGRRKLSKHILICVTLDISIEVSSLQQF